MKRTITPIILVILFLSVLVVSGAQAGEKCTEATLQGPYGFHGHGALGKQLFAAVGVVTFDGAGHADVIITSSRDGQIRRDVQLGTASYTVNSDCTASIDGRDPGPGSYQDMVIVDGGNEIRSLGRDPDSPVQTVVIANLYKKQRVEECTAADMEGTWGYTLSGSIFEDESVYPTAIIGQVTFDGVRRLIGTELRVVGDEFVKLPVDTTYTVASDCTVQTAGLSYGVLVGDGSEAFLIRTIDGWVVTGFPKKL